MCAAVSGWLALAFRIGWYRRFTLGGTGVSPVPIMKHTGKMPAPPIYCSSVYVKTTQEDCDARTRKSENVANIYHCGRPTSGVLLAEILRLSTFHNRQARMPVLLFRKSCRGRPFWPFSPLRRLISPPKNFGCALLGAAGANGSGRESSPLAKAVLPNQSRWASRPTNPPRCIWNRAARAAGSD